MRLATWTLVLVSLAPAASAGFKDGNKLKQELELADRAFSSGGTAPEEWAGTDKTIEWSIAANGGVGYILGVQDFAEAAGAVCSPQGVKVVQLTSLVLKYLREHPEQLHMNGAAVTLSALVQAFPCPKK